MQSMCHVNSPAQRIKVDRDEIKIATEKVKRSSENSVATSGEIVQWGLMTARHRIATIFCVNSLRMWRRLDGHIENLRSG